MENTREALREEFREPEARHDYADMFLDSSIALQIKALRQQRGWTQEELAERASLKQSQISAMEQATFSSWTVKTLRKLAKAFDLALTVRLESFGWLLDDALSVSRKELERPSFEQDPAFNGSGDERTGLRRCLADRIRAGEGIDRGEPVFDASRRSQS